MGRTIKYCEILKAVIKTVAVNMMNYLFFFKRTAEVFFHHKAVFEDISLFVRGWVFRFEKKFVSSVINIPSFFVPRFTTFKRIRDLLNGFRRTFFSKPVFHILIITCTLFCVKLVNPTRLSAEATFNPVEGLVIDQIGLSEETAATTYLKLDATNDPMTGALDMGTNAISGVTSVTATSFIIGFKTLDINEWTQLDGIDQFVGTTGNPTFRNTTISAGFALDVDTLELGNDGSKGYISDSTGSITFLNENLDTTGTLSAGATTVTSLDAGSGLIQTTGELQADTGVFTGLVSQAVFTDNIVYGLNAGLSLEAGALRNTLLGHNAGNSITTGDNNTLIGDDAGKLIVAGGNSNTIVGSSAGPVVTTGDFNTLLGYQSGLALITDSEVTALGYRAGAAATVGQFTSIGAFAGENNDKVNNVFVGYKAGQATIANSQNTYIGYQAALLAEGGSGGTFIGANIAPLFVGTAVNSDGNVLIGFEAGKVFIAGANNTIVGRSSGTGLGTGGSNTLFGAYTVVGVGDFGNATAFGSNAGQFQTGSNNTFMGNLSGTGVSGQSSGGFNTFYGAQSGRGFTTGTSNVAMGYQAGRIITTGDENTSYGTRALERATGESSDNVAVGALALRASGEFFRNTGVGYNAGQDTLGDDNTFLGYVAGANVANVDDNTIIGAWSGFTNITGASNTYLGFRAGHFTTGGSNVFLGNYAGENQASVSNTFIVHNQDEGNASLELTSSLIVGTFNATTASQTLTFNADVTHTYNTTLKGDTTFVGSGSGLEYGDMYVVDNSTETTISGIGVANKVQFTLFGVNGVSNGSVTPDHTNDHITAGVAGDYLITCAITADSIAGSGASYSFDIYVNNGATAKVNIHAHRDMPAGGGVEASISMSGITTLSASDTVELWIHNETNTQNIILSDVTLSLVQLGGG